MNSSLRASGRGPRGFISSPRAAVVSALLLALVLIPRVVGAQLGGSAIPDPDRLVRATAAPVRIQAGGTAEAIVTLEIEKTWHINANPPRPDYMIPTTLELAAAHGIRPGRPIYPLPQTLKVGYEDSELLVYGERATVRVPLSASASASNGKHTLQGKIEFQACNDQVCLAPVTVPVTVEVVVEGGGAATPGGAGADTSGAMLAPGGEDTGGADTSAGAGTSSSGDEPAQSGALPPLQSSSAALDNPVARIFAEGGWTSFAALFVAGLLLNLTPCIYPMLGVTISIFGARRAAPPLQVLGLAIVYVLGMAVMYSSLGLIAALTGGLFGGLLQNPPVLVGLGVLFLALSLSMFGLYELQPPAALLNRLGGTATTSVLGVFLAGLVVGVFAAPCAGPPIAALLVVVGAKGDPWFGFSSFFVLSMGLGAPYLLLAPFSNLLQSLPRSGEWMNWVKKVFGVVLAALGVFYALLALAPGWALWVPPVALIVGGAYLGFFEKSAQNKPTFRWIKRLTGSVAAIAGAIIVVTTPSKSEGIAFEPFSPEGLQAALASGQPAMLDFTANWCAPCHELERFTFTDRRVRDRARAFRTFRVDLTRYKSPESERWRREYAIKSVPTVIFIRPEGEVETARVEGFLPPAQFLERMDRAAAAGPAASATN